MCERKIEGIPCMPGNYFTIPTCGDFRRTAIHGWSQGYPTKKDEFLGVGNTVRPEMALNAKDLYEVFNYDPVLTYGRPKARPLPPVVPSFVKLAFKTLKFAAYFKESVPHSPDESYRVRQVEILYYLEDDTIMVQEPVIENSGLMQGKFLRRHRIPKNDLGETYHWKDINLRCEIMFYARVFRVIDCDCYTKEFYKSEGIILNDPEPMPKDPWTDRYMIGRQQRKFVSPDDPVKPDLLKQERYGSKALRLACVWDDRDSSMGTLRKMELTYWLGDDHVEVREIVGQCGDKDPKYLFSLSRIKLPKDWKDLPLTFPAVYLEPTEKEYVEYYQPIDFKIGATINVFGRRFLIYDMDDFSKQFYRDNFGFTDFTPICVDPPPRPVPKNCPPMWNGYGSPEDDSGDAGGKLMGLDPNLMPKNARKSATFKIVDMDGKVFRYGAIMDSTRPEDQGREFSIAYRLNDDKIAVYEVSLRNTGYSGGKFFDFLRIAKPGSSNECPIYYSPADFYVGAMVDFFGYRFLIKSADQLVIDIMEANPCDFPEHVKENLRNWAKCKKEAEARQPQKAEQTCIPRAERKCDRGKPVCEEPVGDGFFGQLGLGSKGRRFHPCDANPNPCAPIRDWNQCRALGYFVPPGDKCHEESAKETCFPTNPNPCPGDPDMFEKPECAVCTPHRSVPPAREMQNPVLEEEPRAVPCNDYEDYRAHKYDCFRDRTEEEEKQLHAKRLQFYCACPQAEPCQCGLRGTDVATKGFSPNSIQACQTCQCQGNVCGCVNPGLN